MSTAAAKVFEGRTLDVDAPFLSGAFWEVGKKIRGEVIHIKDTIFDGKSSLAYVLELDEPVEVDGDDWERVSIGGLAGFKMALQACGVPRLFLKDQIEMECESIKLSKKENYSPRPNFRVLITRT